MRQQKHDIEAISGRIGHSDFFLTITSIEIGQRLEEHRYRDNYLRIDHTLQLFYYDEAASNGVKCKIQEPVQ